MRMKPGMLHWWMKTLGMIRNAGSIVEVNTRGLYKKRSDSLFPGPAILKKILALGIPITISSDAHKPHELSLFFRKPGNC